MQLLVLKVHEIPKTILKCLNRKIIKRVNIGKLQIKPHLEDRETDCGTRSRGIQKSSYDESTHLLQK